MASLQCMLIYHSEHALLSGDKLFPIHHNTLQSNEVMTNTGTPNTMQGCKLLGLKGGGANKVKRKELQFGPRGRVQEAKIFFKIKEV